MNKKIETEVVVLGSGPGGYSTAFRCADLGLKTILIEKHTRIGGVCLNVGCIPSKALLHFSKIMYEMRFLEKFGINFTKSTLDIEKISSWKKNIINKLVLSLSYMANIRGIKIIHGIAKFKKYNELLIEKNKEKKIIKFQHAVIATGSSSLKLPNLPKDPRIWNSTDALKISKIPNKFLIIGGGIIGLEIATVYSSLGSKIDIIESNKQIIPSADEDVINIFKKEIKKQFNILLETHIENIIAEKSGLYVTYYNKFSGKKTECYDIVLVSVGRIPNTSCLNINKIGIEINKKNFITVDKQMKTNISNIYAIGDITGFPMLAHKAVHQGHVAAEVIAGKKHFFDPKVIPSIAYTNPEVAWIGITEKEAKKMNIEYEIAIFPWKASGRALATNCQNGMTKLIFEKKYGRIIGGAVVGKNGGEILGEIGLAIEMNCYAEDIALTIHAHPTLYESIGLCSEIFTGSITDLINKKRK